MNVADLITKLSQKTGVSGFETEIAEYIANEFSPYCDEVTIDKSGNVIALKKSCNPVDQLDCPIKSGDRPLRVMIAAHMDEIGLMVSNIDEKGFIKFSPLGGIDSQMLLTQEVIIHGRQEVFGVIGHKPPHLCTAEDIKKSVNQDDMAIDTGYSYNELKDLVKVGDIISIKRSVISLQNNKLAGKSFDNMASVAALIIAMDKLKDYNHYADIYYVATVQEELGKLGATTAAYHINPDIGIAVDVYFAQAPGVSEWEGLEIGKGPGIAIGPNVNHGVYDGLLSCARDNNTKHQIYVLPQPIGNDAVKMQISRNGTATGIVSIPLKYMHSSVETISIDDVIQTGNVLSDYIISLNQDDIASH